jgi:hypothetical protein
VCDASEDEEAMRQTLARVRETAICGLYRSCLYRRRTGNSDR